MPKCYGEQYDPALRKTEHGSRIYAAWRTMRKHPHCEEWEYFPTFYEWAMQSEYEIGAWLRLVNARGTYCPDNCYWNVPSSKEEPPPPEWADGWNKTVNRIRKHYGMPPLEGTTYGD